MKYAQVCKAGEMQEDDQQKEPKVSRLWEEGALVQQSTLWENIQALRSYTNPG